MALHTFVLSCFVPFSAGCGFRMTGGCLAGETRLFSLKPCHVKHSRALWELVIPWYSKRLCTHISWSAVGLHTHTLLQDGGKWGERSSTSVMEQEVLEQTALHTITASNMWTRVMCSCCGLDIDSFPSQGSIHGPAVVHSSVTST